MGGVVDRTEWIFASYNLHSVNELPLVLILCLYHSELQSARSESAPIFQA
jgi:hypothetical protein